jgi:hypothetical protein
MSVETHQIYPIGLHEDGDVYCVAVHARGFADWFKLFADFDLFDELDQPTLRDEELQELLPSEYEVWEEEEVREVAA